MQHKDILNKIRKLLRLSQSSNVYEAAAAAAKAQELLSKYNLERESIRFDDEASEAQSIYKKTRQRLEGWAHYLANGSADAFDCRYYHERCSGSTVFVGVGADPEVCGWMYGYLYKTLLRLASEYMRTKCKRLRSNISKKRARESFLLGAVSIIIDRLMQQKHATPASSTSLVLSKNTLIEAALPKLIERQNEK
ncbi:MAG: DUF2786 domain-containing protein, partial [Desulfovibrionaceae bacterium]